MVKREACDNMDYETETMELRGLVKDERFYRDALAADVHKGNSVK